MLIIYDLFFELIYTLNVLIVKQKQTVQNLKKTLILICYRKYGKKNV